MNWQQFYTPVWERKPRENFHGFTLTPWKAGKGFCVSSFVPELPAAITQSRLWDKDKENANYWEFQTGLDWKGPKIAHPVPWAGTPSITSGTGTAGGTWSVWHWAHPFVPGDSSASICHTGTAQTYPKHRRKLPHPLTGYSTKHWPDTGQRGQLVPWRGTPWGAHSWAGCGWAAGTLGQGCCQGKCWHTRSHCSSCCGMSTNSSKDTTGNQEDIPAASSSRHPEHWGMVL